jgi:hypothetical protein
MSNRVSLQFCEFIDHATNGNIIARYWGYRIYDDYDVDYNNIFSSLRELQDTITPDSAEDYIRDNHPEFLSEFTRGFYLNNDWIDIKGDEEEEDDE